MTQFLSLLLNGISLGVLYALIALGFVIIFKASEVVSFTARCCCWAPTRSPSRRTRSASSCRPDRHLVTALAFVIERLIINRLRGAPVISLAIVTIGVDIILLTELIRGSAGHPQRPAPVGRRRLPDR